MKTLRRVAPVLVGASILFVVPVGISAQGFINLSFEQAVLCVAPTPAGVNGSFIDPHLAFNGWTVTNLGPGANGGVFTLYNNVTLGSSAVNLIGPNFPNVLNLSPLQGSYSVLLQQSPQTNSVGSPGLYQNGLIPTDARSINFLLGYGDPSVRLNGVEIALNPIGGGRVAGDITPFAGQNAELVFGAQGGIGNFVYFDDIRFSAQVVPEPSTYALGILAFLAFMFARRLRR